MKRSKRILAALCLTAGSLSIIAQPAHARVEAGLLTCEVGGGFALIVSSPRALHCVFHKPNGQTEAYGGRLTAFGLDVGVSGRGVISWAVVAATTDLPPGELTGKYGGVEAGASAIVGGSGRVLIGGTDRTIALQPLSVEARSGVNIAAGVAGMELHPLFRVSPRAARVQTPAVGIRHSDLSHAHKTSHYSCGSYTHLQRGQTLSGVAHACGVTLEALLDVNPDITNVRNISAGALIHIPNHIGHHGASPCGDRAILGEDEGLDHLAWRCGVTLHSILIANPDIRDTGLIQPGLIVNIPARSGPQTQPPVQFARTAAELPGDGAVAADHSNSATVLTRPQINSMRSQVGSEARKIARLELICEAEATTKYKLNPNDVFTQTVTRSGLGSFSVLLDADGGDAVCLISQQGVVQFIAYESEFATPSRNNAQTSQTRIVSTAPASADVDLLLNDADEARIKLGLSSDETLTITRVGPGKPTVESGNLKGYQATVYAFQVPAGQSYEIELETDSDFAYFNVVSADDPNGLALFAGEREGSNKTTVTFPSEGIYLIRPFLNRAAARRSEAAEYKLTISASVGGDRVQLNEPITSLAGTTWRPLEINGGGIPDGAEPIVQFDTDRQISGTGGCNRFSGSYSLNGNSLRFGPLATTRMACPQMAMDLEDRFLAALGATRNASRDGAEMILSDDDGMIVARLSLAAGQGSSNVERRSAPSSLTDALVPGTNFNATGIIPCARSAGQSLVSCEFGVVREGGGSGSITVTWPDGGSRVIFFEAGTPMSYDESEADNGAELTVGKEADLFKIEIGEQRFEVPEAVIVGG